MLLVYEKRREDAEEFLSHFEGFVDAICDAAQHGLTENLSAKYQQHRDWLRNHVYLVRTPIEEFVPPTKSVESPEGDDFLALFAAPDLASQLSTDDGNMISRIVRTREALDVYSVHLQQLIDREKSCS
jgi:hypothetical protein